MENDGIRILLKRMVRDIDILQKALARDLRRSNDLPPEQYLDSLWEEHIAREINRIKKDPLSWIKYETPESSDRTKGIVAGRLTADHPFCAIQHELKALDIKEDPEFEFAKYLLLKAKERSKGWQCRGEIERTVTSVHEVVIGQHWKVKCPLFCRHRPSFSNPDDPHREGENVFHCRLYLPYHRLADLEQIGNAAILTQPQPVELMEYIYITVFMPLADPFYIITTDYDDFIQTLADHGIIIDFYGYFSTVRKAMLASDLVTSQYKEYVSRTKLNAAQLVASVSDKIDPELARDISLRKELIAGDLSIWKWLTGKAHNPLEDS